MGRTHPIDRPIVVLLTIILLLTGLQGCFDSDDDDEKEEIDEPPTVYDLRGDVIHFGVSADQHYGASNGMVPPHDTDTIEDWMDHPDLPEMDFVIATMGDWISDSRMPGKWTDVDYTWRQIVANNADHQRIPYFWTFGNHDITNYDNMVDGDPVRKERLGRSISGMNENNYAFMYNNVLFICAAQTNVLYDLSQYQETWIEYLVDRYGDHTTVILSHQATAETTGAGHDRSSSWNGNDYGVHNDIDWWYSLFDDNPQIVLYIHGHKEKGYDTIAHDLHGETWDDDCTFVLVPSNGRYTTGLDQGGWSYIFSITDSEVAIQLWDSANGTYQDFEVTGLPYLREEMDNSVSSSGMEWYSIPKQVMDGQTWTWNNHMVAEDYLIELIGSDVTEHLDNADLIGFDSNLATRGYFYSVRGDEALLNLYSAEEDDFIKVPGGKVLEIATSPSNAGKHIEGNVPYNTAIAVPGKEYEFGVYVRSVNGTGTLDLDITIPTYRDLDDLAANITVLSNVPVDENYTWISSNFTVPVDPDVWFIQPKVRFRGTNQTYFMDAWSLSRVANGSFTRMMSVVLNGNSYSTASTLAPGEHEGGQLDHELMDNELGFRCSIDGNRVGIVQLVYVRPQLWSDDVSFGWRENGTAAYIRDISPFNNRTTIMSFENSTVGIDGFEVEVVRRKHFYTNTRYAAGVEGIYDLVTVSPPE